VARKNGANSIPLLTQSLVQRHAASTGIGVNRVRTQPDQHLDQNLSAVDCLRSFFDSSQRRDPYFLVFNWTKNPTFSVGCRDFRSGNTTNFERLKRRTPFFGRCSHVHHAQNDAFPES
jgi:hypothetical protein